MNNEESNSKVKTFRRFIRINGKLVSKTFQRKTDADRWYVEKRRQKDLVEGGIASPVEAIRLKDYVQQWMAKRKAHGKPESSWKADERRLRLHILPVMAERILYQVTRKEWTEFLDSLLIAKEMNPASRNRVHSILRKLYNDALRDEVVQSNPLVGIPKLREAQDKWDYWHSHEECQTYLATARLQDPAFFIFATLALNTGARVGELLALQYEDVQIEQRRIHIWRTYEQETKTICNRTKGKTDRWLGINEAVYQALVDHKRQAVFKKQNDLLICRDDGKPLEEWMIRNRHLRVCRRAELKKIRVHDLRHTYASHYVMGGGNLSDLQALLGHSSPEMTRKYAHLTPGHLESKACVISFGAKAPQPENVSVVSRISDYQKKRLTPQ